MKVAKRVAIPMLSLALPVACGDDEPRTPAATEEGSIGRRSRRGGNGGARCRRPRERHRAHRAGHELAHDEGLDAASDHGDEALEALEAGDADAARVHRGSARGDPVVAVRRIVRSAVEHDDLNGVACRSTESVAYGRDRDDGGRVEVAPR